MIEDAFKDYVRMQWLMLQQDKPEDFVIATGHQHAVRDFINLAAKALELDLEWHGSGLDEVGVCDGKEIVRVDPKYFRPTEVESLLGDPRKAKRSLVGSLIFRLRNSSQKWLSMICVVPSEEQIIETSGLTKLR